MCGAQNSKDNDTVYFRPEPKTVVNKGNTLITRASFDKLVPVRKYDFVVYKHIDRDPK
jgi:hypothetical protein